MEEEHREHYQKPRGIIKLWLGALAAPVAWTLQLQTVYSATPFLCEHGSMVLPYVVTLVALLLALGGILLAYESWRATGHSMRSDGQGVIGRTRLFALVGMGGSAFFLVVIIVQALPILLLEPCD